jgi:signal transduction histidine kinase/CheY-like chemotaxis protein
LKAISTLGSRSWNLKDRKMPEKPEASSALDAEWQAAVGGDVNKLRAALISAEQRLKERGSFLSVMSHEMRDPMNGVLGMARLLRDTPLDEEQGSYVDAMINSAESLVTLVNDLLDLSKIDAGKLELNSVDFALPAFFRRLAEVFELRTAAKGINFSLDLAPNLPELVRGDPARLRQIVTNLLGNALKFTSKGRVRLAVAAPEERRQKRMGIVLRVSDTGIGIPREHQANLFSAYAQCDPGAARLYGGTGLGLTIAQRLARLMNGGIVLEQSGASGTIFVVNLELDPARGSASRLGRTAIAGARLLIADSQHRSAQTMAESARLWGMDVRIVATLAEAMTVLRESADRGSPFDFAVVDRGLTDRRGDDIGPMVREEAILAGLKLVLLVTAGYRGDAAAVQRIGFHGYIQKPVTASTLLDILQQLHDAKASGDLLTVHSLSERRAKPLRLLIADDNPINCRLSGIMLERAGHVVETVTNGAEAVAAVAEGEFDAVLMDVQMPVMTGLEATRKIRSLPDPLRAATPIIAITANAMRGDSAECYAAGMSGYVTKPVDSSVLLEAIDRLTLPASGSSLPSR